MPFELKCSILTNFGMPISGRGGRGGEEAVLPFKSQYFGDININFTRFRGNFHANSSGVFIPISVISKYQYLVLK